MRDICYYLQSSARPCRDNAFVELLWRWVRIGEHWWDGCNYSENRWYRIYWTILCLNLSTHILQNTPSVTHQITVVWIWRTFGKNCIVKSFFGYPFPRILRSALKQWLKSKYYFTKYPKILNGRPPGNEGINNNSSDASPYIWSLISNGRSLTNMSIRICSEMKNHPSNKNIHLLYFVDQLPVYLNNFVIRSSNRSFSPLPQPNIPQSLQRLDLDTLVLIPCLWGQRKRSISAVCAIPGGDKRFVPSHCSSKQGNFTLNYFQISSQTKTKWAIVGLSSLWAGGHRRLEICLSVDGVFGCCVWGFLSCS